MRIVARPRRSAEMGRASRMRLPSQHQATAEPPPKTDPVQLSNSRVPSRSVEFLGESDEKPFRPADVAKPILILIPDYIAHELCAALAKPAKRLVDVVHGEHDPEVA